MAIRLRDMINKTRQLEIDFDGEIIEVIYRPHAVTISLLDEMEKHPDDKAVLHQIEAVVERWAVTDDDGKEIPPTVENCTVMPLDFLTHILEHITEDMKGWSKEEKKS